VPPHVVVFDKSEGGKIDGLPLCLPSYRSNSLRLETELHSCLIPQVALVVVPVGKGISEAGEQVIKLSWADCDLRGKRNVDTATNHEVPSIIGWGFVGRETRGIQATLINVAVEIGVRSPEQHLTKRLEVLRAVFENRSNVVGKQISLRRKLAALGAIRRIRRVNVLGVAAITLEVTFDSNVLAEIISDGTASAVQVEGPNNIVILWIKMNERIIDSYFNLVILCKYVRRADENNRECQQ